MMMHSSNPSTDLSPGGPPAAVPATVNTGQPVVTAPAVDETLAPATNAIIPTTITLKTDLKAALSDRQNLQNLVLKLYEIATRLGKDAIPQAEMDELTKRLTPDEIAAQLDIRVPVHSVLAALKTTPIEIHPDSSYPVQTGNAVTLETLIKAYGLPMPTCHHLLTHLSSTLNDRALVHPLGDFGGGLSWPVPLSASAQRTVLNAATGHASRHPNKPEVGASLGVLEYLNSNQPLSGDALHDPTKALEMIVSSDRGQTMGLAVQIQLNGISTDTSINEYALTAINLVLDPESIAEPNRNKVAGFDLAQQQHWGKPASTVVDGLNNHLSTTGKTGPEMTKVGTYLLLARKAPEFLIKDIPDSVTFGSAAWVRLSVAAATIEAQSPGAVPNMKFAQVMLKAESAAKANPAVTEQAQKAALVDWGVAIGVLKKEDHEENYSTAQLERLRVTFNDQQTELTTASQSLDAEILTRREIALEILKQRFGHIVPPVPFEEKCIRTAYRAGGQKFPNAQSLLDLAMMDVPDLAALYSTDSRIPIDTLNANRTFGVRAAFAETFRKSIEEKEQAIQTSIKHLITQLPLKDRKNFEYGKITFYQKSSHTLGAGLWGTIPGPKILQLWVKTERDGVPTTGYVIDINKGTIESASLDNMRLQSSRQSNVVSEIKAFLPDTAQAVYFTQTQALNDSLSMSASSSRSRNIAHVFLQHLDLVSQTQKIAEGNTDAESRDAELDVTRQFFLNLIPFRSAIVNLRDGNYWAGALDLGLDIFGFVTAGVGVAGKLTKLGSTAISATSKALMGAKIIGAAAISAFNPLSGAGDLIMGSAKLLGKGTHFVISKGVEAVNKLRGTSGSYDLLKAAGKDYGVAATGTFKVAEHSVEGGAIFQNGQWYSYNVARKQPYGPPLNDFKPHVAAAGEQLKVLRSGQPDLLDYEIKNISMDALQVKGLQANVYVGANKAEYIKVEEKLYKSALKDGERYVVHPGGNGPDFMVRDLGASGWEPRLSSNRLLGGAPKTPTKWKLGNETFIMPMDDVALSGQSSYPYMIECRGKKYNVFFDTEVGAWKHYDTHLGLDAGKTVAVDASTYFWRVGPARWKQGTLKDFSGAKKINSHKFTFVDAPSPITLQIPAGAKPIPKDIHYFWAGKEIPLHLKSNIANSAKKSPGYKTIVHVDADTPTIFQSMKRDLEAAAPGIEVKNLHQDEFFKELQATEIYQCFRWGQGQNFAATSDVARYSLLKKYGGIYLDTDDKIVKSVGEITLVAGPNDILLNGQVMNAMTDYKYIYNNSNFAVQPDNPVLDELIAEMNARFVKNKLYFNKKRPTVSTKDFKATNYTPEFKEYSSKIFETTGPVLLNDMLKLKRPDMYGVDFDKTLQGVVMVGNEQQVRSANSSIKNELSVHYARKGLTLPDDIKKQTSTMNLDSLKDYYLPFDKKFEVEIGGDGSWIVDTP